jgi:hypothetical protein
MQSTRLLAVLVLLPVLAFAQSQGKKKHSVPAVFNNARYVWVESTDGDIFTPGLLPADRNAIVDVQNALRDWGRYALTPDRANAELIFIVRTGRIAEGQVGGSVGAPNSGPMGNPNPGQQQHPMGTGVMVGGEVGPADDLLKVVMTNSESRGIQVWMRTEEGGLASPSVPLLQQLKTAVDHDYPR